MTNREEKVAAVDEEIENDLEIIGSTAIEDRLQDEVADTIQFMKNTGIKVWVLTGDKIETAMNIGLSAGLLDSEMDKYVVEEGESELRDRLETLSDDILKNKNDRKQAIIVAGSSLVAIDADEMFREKFLEASDSADVVLACRVSPKQKADIVNMIRKRFPSKVTLSIGDGANDVNMILQAHVGVGIFGKEGQQAARSADYAIGQFKFLKPLLFIHGREAYRRNSFLMAYTFYKNVLYVVPQYYFGFNSAFSGQTLYEPVIYQLYNITMTSLPIMWFALFDFEYTKEIFMAKCKLYKLGMQSECFSSKIFIMWLLYALVHGAIIYAVSMIALVRPSVKQSDGQDLGFWVAGMTCYGAAVLVVNALLLFNFNNFTRYGELLVLMMMTAYFLFLGIESASGLFPVVAYIYSTMFTQYTVWLSLFLSTAGVSAMVLAIRAWKVLIGFQSAKVNGDHVQLNNPESDEGGEEMEQQMKKKSKASSSSSKSLS